MLRTDNAIQMGIVHENVEFYIVVIGQGNPPLYINALEGGLDNCLR